MKQKSFTKGRSLFLFTLLFSSLFFISLVEAQPPFIQPVQPFINGYVIEIPDQGVLKANQDFNFFFHVFNISSGLPLTDDIVNCEFNLHDSTSRLVHTDTSLFFDDTTTAFNVTILGGNFTPQDYTYVTHCNSTDFGGFISVEVTVTPTGLGDIFDFYILILLISAVIIIFGFWIKDAWVVILGTFGLYFVGLYIILNGIVGIQDRVTTWAFALVILGVAAYISIKSSLEVIEGG